LYFHDINRFIDELKALVAILNVPNIVRYNCSITDFHVLELITEFCRKSCRDRLYKSVDGAVLLACHAFRTVASLCRHKVDAFGLFAVSPKPMT